MNELFFLATAGLYKIVIGNTESCNTSGNINLSLSAMSPEDLLIDLLNEINYYLMIKNVAIRNGGSLSIFQKNEEYNLLLEAETFQVKPDLIKCEIKAATYHQLKIEKTDMFYFTRIYFDI